MEAVLAKGVEERFVVILLPVGTWDYFCLDNVLYHGRNLTILWDKTGRKYYKGQGLHVFVDGKRIANVSKLKRIVAKID